MERKIRLSRIRRWKRRRHGRQIWISKPELKHSNDKIIINIYIYNRQYTFLLKRLYNLKNKGAKLKKTIIKSWKNKHTGLRTHKVLYIDYWKFLKKKIKIKRKKLVKFLSKNLILLYIYIKYNNTYIYKYINTYGNKLHTRYIHKILQYQVVYMRYKESVLLNRFKFKDTYLKPIKHLMQKIYNKKVEFNLVLLKRFNYDSSILAQIIAYKINIRSRKTKPLRVIKTSIRKSQVHKFNKRLLETDIKSFNKQNYILGNFNQNINKFNDHFNKVLNIELYNNNINVENTVFDKTKNKYMLGIKVQVSGRITRRLIAQRAQCKMRYKGTLKDIDSTYRGLPTVILKGHEKSTIQYTHLAYKRKIGSFGFKGWINTY